ncbi:hypothetical protein EN817_32085, partial [Mesorhizobium sp. M3A.F.Ca.ET.174.01.1.1]|uniref:hypothetical protein n=1 Tax=Mesorhizobium sp. M3A.F.Ca.ET.174.01.1.1 TaxID=2563944 RepID=UPI00113875B3
DDTRGGLASLPRQALGFAAAVVTSRNFSHISVRIARFARQTATLTITCVRRHLPVLAVSFERETFWANALLRCAWRLDSTARDATTMNAKNLFQLLILAALWGASFLFIRV